MSSKISISYEGEYILVQQTGRNSYEDSLTLWKNTVKACESYKCSNILGISDMKDPHETLDAFNHKDIFKEAGITHNYRIAWVEKNPEARETLKFIETVLKNRALAKGYVFSDIAEAKKWLLEN